MQIKKANICKNNSILNDLRFYFLNKPKIKTLVEYNLPEEREDFCQRIVKQLGVPVSEYSVINVHQIGIDAPLGFVFDELLNWDGNSDYWPNKIACVKRINGSLENILIYMLGIEKIKFKWLREIFIEFKPLFNLTALKFQYDSSNEDTMNARYLLYTCCGGYPIGIFSLYVRDSVQEEDEKGKAQLFSIVAFNFYGKKNWFYTKIINPIWKKIHNRVTGNVLNRIKQEFENKFKSELIISENIR